VLKTAFLLALAATAVPAQSLAYTRLRAEGAVPLPRSDGAIAYDQAGRQVFLFGGLGGFSGQETPTQNDLWAYSLDRQQWVQAPVAGSRPPARFGHTMVLDAPRRRLIVFGGQAGGFFSDVWAYDIALGNWQQLSRDEAGPSRRYGHSAIYDTARDRMVISHGFTDSGRFDDTWAFEFAGNAWRNLSPSGSRPLRRCLHHAAYDGTKNQMLLYGGCASGAGPCPLGDLWSFDLAANRWTERTTTLRPPARQWYGMAFDAARSRLVIFGGSGAGLLGDTWEYDPGTNAWQQASIEADTPAPRERHEAAFAPDLRATLFFGGRTGGGLTNELLLLAPAASGRPQIASGGVVNGFSGLAGPRAPGEIVSIFGASLGPSVGVATSFDQTSGRLPTSAAGVSVAWNGIPAPLYFVRADQLNVQVPYEVANASEAELVVTHGSSSSLTERVRIAPTRPGLFPRVFHPDFSFVTPENPAAPGGVVVLFATGQGVTNPPSRTGAFPDDIFPAPAAPVTIRIGGRTADLLFQGQAPGTAGVMQINARVPEGLTSSSTVPVSLQIGEGQSQDGVTVPIR